MTIIYTIPTEELLQDLADAKADIAVCQSALDIGVTEYTGGSVLDRLNCNKRQIEVIKAELELRSKE